MKKSTFVSDFLKPVLVLFCIAAVVAVVLAVVNSVTAPVIEENDRIAAEQKRKDALSTADSFMEVELSRFSEVEGITGFYVGKNASNEPVGFVVTASFQGYGGQVVSTVGIGNDCKVLSVISDVSTETSGVGSKCGHPDFLARFKGLSYENPAAAGSVDGISGASRTSNAVKKGVQAALEAIKVYTRNGGAVK